MIATVPFTSGRTSYSPLLLGWGMGCNGVRGRLFDGNGFRKDEMMCVSFWVEELLKIMSMENSGYNI